MSYIIYIIYSISVIISIIYSLKCFYFEYKSSPEDFKDKFPNIIYIIFLTITSMTPILNLVMLKFSIKQIKHLDEIKKQKENQLIKKKTIV